MRKDVDHLPAKQQGELERVQRVLMDEFAEAISRATSPSRRTARSSRSFCLVHTREMIGSTSLRTAISLISICLCPKSGKD